MFNGEIRLSLVESTGTDDAYSHIHQICPKSTVFVYQTDNGMKKIENERYAKVWCMHGKPDTGKPFSEWDSPGGQMSVNEWLVHNGYAVLDKSSCKRSDFGGQSWARGLGC